MAQHQELRFILLGKTGAGKSSTGNFILQRNVVVPQAGVNPGSWELLVESGFLSNGRVVVVDTPGIYSNTRSMLETALEMQRSLSYVMPGPHAFLLVITLARFIAEDDQTIDFLRIMFGETLFRHAIIIFTHEDNMPRNAQRPVHFRNHFDQNPILRQLLNRRGGRFLTLNNHEMNAEVIQAKLEQLLQLANQVSRIDRFYTENIESY